MWELVRQQIYQLSYVDESWNTFGWLEENTFMQPATVVGQLSRDDDLNLEALIMRYFDGVIPEVKLGESLSHELVDRYNMVREVFDVLVTLARDRERLGDERDVLDIVLDDLHDWYIGANPEFLGEDDLILAWHISNKFGVNTAKDANARRHYRLQESWDEKRGRNHAGDESSEFDDEDAELGWEAMYKAWNPATQETYDVGGRIPTVGNTLVYTEQFTKGTRLNRLELKTKQAMGGWADPIGILSKLMSELARQLEAREPEVITAGYVWYRIPMLDGVPVIKLHEPSYRGMIRVSKPRVSKKGEEYVLVDVPFHVLAGLWRLRVPDPVGLAWDIVKNMTHVELLAFLKSLSRQAKLFKATCLALWEMNFGQFPGVAIKMPMCHAKVTYMLPVQCVIVSMFKGTLLTRLNKVFARAPQQGPLAAAQAYTVTASKWDSSIPDTGIVPEIYTFSSSTDLMSADLRVELHKAREFARLSRESIWIVE